MHVYRGGRALHLCRECSGCFSFSRALVYGEVSLAVSFFITMGSPQANGDSKFICGDLWRTRLFFILYVTYTFVFSIDALV